MLSHRRLYMQSLTWAYLASPCHWNVGQPLANDRYWVRFPAGGCINNLNTLYGVKHRHIDS